MLRKTWFGVKLLLHAVDGEGRVRLAEESVRLVAATSMDEAFKKDYKPEDVEDDFRVDGDPCKWVLHRVLDVFDIDELPGDGVEVYSLIMTPHEADIVDELYSD